ncbi:hypothetical protein [uncultured Roseobacter sp.]|nr:hypothetical protein [uncultured Roseobacter sp.]
MIFTTKYTIEGFPISAHKSIAVNELIMDLDIKWGVLIGTPATKATY